MKLIENKAKCKNCKDIIESINRHDWISCKCFRNEKENQGIFIDGGLDYCRRGGNLQNFIDLSKWEEDKNNV